MGKERCALCPRNCSADRKNGEKGICGQTDRLKVARAALHHWEEPCISGENGSGTVFFSGCPLRCVFCQNREIALGNTGKEISVGRLAEIFLELKEKGAHNINLVTPGHFAPQIAAALEAAKGQGMDLPVVYNTGSYESLETVKSLEGLVDVYLPDFKYMSETLSQKYSHAPDYASVAQNAIAEMVRQRGDAVFEGGLMTSGVLVRHLVLPGQTKDSKAVIRYLYETYGNRIFISIMNQFTPSASLESYPELNRKLTAAEYDEVVDYAISLGVENGYIQEGETAEESFIPAFDWEGV